MTLLIAARRIPDYTLFLLQGGVPPTLGAPSRPSWALAFLAVSPSLQPVPTSRRSVVTTRLNAAPSTRFSWPVILGSNVAAGSACILVLKITQVLIIVPLHKAPKN